MNRVSVLIVEDEQDVLDVMAEMVAFFGYRVKTLGDGLEALEEIGHTLYGLIITDLGLPGLEGAELIRRIRSNAVDTPVLVITGVDFNAAEHGLGRISNLGFLQKPFKMDDLKAAIETALDLTPPRPVRIEKQKLNK